MLRIDGDDTAVAQRDAVGVVGSVISGAFIIPWARAKYSPQRITTFANLLLLLNFCLMAFVHRPYVFLVVAALGSMGCSERGHAKARPSATFKIIKL